MKVGIFCDTSFNFDFCKQLGNFLGWGFSLKMCLLLQIVKVRDNLAEIGLHLRHLSIAEHQCSLLLLVLHLYWYLVSKSRYMYNEFKIHSWKISGHAGGSISVLDQYKPYLDEMITFIGLCHKKRKMMTMTRVMALVMTMKDDDDKDDGIANDTGDCQKMISIIIHSLGKLWYVSVCPTIYLSVCLSVHLSVCQKTCFHVISPKYFAATVIFISKVVDVTKVHFAFKYWPQQINEHHNHPPHSPPNMIVNPS